LESERQFCPWCDTEIIWDPELGPEEVCPHCLNELGDYRSIEIHMDPPEDETELEGPDASKTVAGSEFNASRHIQRASPKADDDAINDIDDDTWEAFDEAEHDALLAYEANVQRCQDEQDEVPECMLCREFMLHVGDERHDQPAFEPRFSPALGKSLLKPSYAASVYVCPSCFRIEYRLSEDDRLELVQRLKENG